MAKIEFKSKLSSAVANATFLLKTEAQDTITAKIALENTDTESGANIQNIQKYINQIAESLGVVGEDDPNRDVYSSTNYVSNGDSRKVAIGALDAQGKINSDAIIFNEDDIADIIASIGVDSSTAPINIGICDLDANGEIPSARIPDIFLSNQDGSFNTNYAEKTSPVEDDIVIIEDSENSYTKKKVKLENMLGGGVGFQETPSGTINGVNDTFSITKLPLTNESVLPILNGRILENSEYSFTHPNIVLNTPPVLGQSLYVFYITDGSAAVNPVGGNQDVVYHTLNASEVTAKQITLPNTPTTSSKVMLDIIQGSSQHYGVDFTVSGTTLSWSGLNLDGNLNANDVLRINYLY